MKNSNNFSGSPVKILNYLDEEVDDTAAVSVMWQRSVLLREAPYL